MSPFKFLFCLSILFPSITAAAIRTPVPADVNFYPDIEYARVAGAPLLLDLYVPASAPKPLPLVIWIHGGGWCKGSKSSALPLALGFTSKGYAVASVEYRFTDKAVFPAQVWDCKAAVRFLRANASKYSLDPNHFGAWGDSAGGHLVALLAATSHSRVLDGNEGPYTGTSSSVQAVCDYYGPTDFTAISGTEPDSIWRQPNNYADRLIGASIIKDLDKARFASPITYISPHTVPCLIIHGSDDKLVPVSQSISFYNALKKSAVPAQLKVLQGAVHGGKPFIDPNTISLVQAFFDSHLKKNNQQKLSSILNYF